MNANPAVARCWMYLAGLMESITCVSYVLESPGGFIGDIAIADNFWGLAPGLAIINAHGEPRKDPVLELTLWIPSWRDHTERPFMSEAYLAFAQNGDRTTLKLLVGRHKPVPRNDDGIRRCSQGN